MPSASSRRSSRSAIAETFDPAGQLAPLARLALAYAPARTRADWLTLLALDARLAGVVRAAREPMLAQLRLAWWRDRLNDDPAKWPKGEPLLARLSAWREPAGLAPLVDGWEALLGDPPLAGSALDLFAVGRTAALAVLAGQVGAAPAPILARRWALADLALHLGDAAEQASAAALLEQTPPAGSSARALRPLLVLAGVSERALARGGQRELYGPGAFATAVRLGVFGR